MELVKSRNPQSAMRRLLNMLYTDGTQEDGQTLLQGPITFVYERPRERLVFWPGFQRNPAKELTVALHSIRDAETSIAKASKSVVDGARHFIFSTPQLVVQANIDDGKFNMHTVVAEQNPFQGAFGQLALQLTLLQELMANSVGLQIGVFSIQHMSMKIPTAVVTKLLNESIENPPKDPYQNGMKTRKIDNTLELAMLMDEGVRAQGYRSKWVRLVALPLFMSSSEEDPKKAIHIAKKIKSDDWRRCQIEYLQAHQEMMAIEEKAAAAQRAKIAEEQKDGEAAAE